MTACHRATLTNHQNPVEMGAMSKPLVYSYVRFSSKPQEQGDSITRQERFIADFAKGKGLPVDEATRFNDYGVSGFKEDNIKDGGALLRFMELVETGKIAKGSFLVVENMDRFSRADVMTVNQLLTTIINGGITFVTQLGGSAKEINSQSIRENHFELFMMLMEAQRGNAESQRKADMLKRYWQSKRSGKAVFHKKCPWWLAWNEAKGKYDVIKDRAHVIKDIFTWYAEGLGVKAIIQRLNKAAVPSAKGGKWGSYVQKIIFFRAVIGEMTLKDKATNEDITFPDFYPVIISPQLWNKVSKLRELKKVPLKAAREGISRIRNTTGMNMSKMASNLFTGIITCGYCGGTIHYRYGVKKLADGTKRKHKYLKCSNKAHGVACVSQPWNYEQFEESFLEFAREISITQTDVTKEESQIQELRDKQTATQKSIYNIERAIEEVEDPDAIKGLAKKLEANNGKLRDITQGISGIMATMEEKRKMNSTGMGALNDLVKQPDSQAIRFQVAEQLRVYFKEIKLYSSAKILSRQDEKLLQGADKGIIAAMREPRKRCRFYEAHLKNDDVRMIMPDYDEPRKTRIHLDGHRVQFLSGEMMDISQATLKDASGKTLRKFDRNDFQAHIISAFYMAEVANIMKAQG